MTTYICRICKPLQRSATIDRTLVMSLDQRFESARRLFTIGLDKPMWQRRATPGKRKSADCGSEGRGFEPRRSPSEKQLK
jgi:hypothetical protein